MSRRRTAPLLLVLASTISTSCSRPDPEPSPDPAPPPAANPVLRPSLPSLLAAPTEETAAKLARELIAASPFADPADRDARDTAADRLGKCDTLLKLAGDRILWGGYNPKQGYDPAAYRFVESDFLDPDPSVLRYQLTEFNPAVWARLYLSTFMFTGEFTVHKDGPRTILELTAKFRDGLDSGEYPYPFWHTPTKWTAYVHVEKLLLVLEPGRIVSAMRASAPEGSVNLVKKPWDGHWTWTDADGREQPRVALFNYQFSADNPHVGDLDTTFRALAESFRAHTCMDCHAPNNLSHMNDLLLLNYPNQALAARRTLVSTILENSMPPGNRLAGEPTGIEDEHEREEMLRLTKAFVEKADAAFEFEKRRAAKPPQ